MTMFSKTRINYRIGSRFFPGNGGLKPIFLILLLVSMTASGDTPPVKKDYPIQPVPFTQVTVSDHFWRDRLETNQKVTIPYAFKMCEETGRIQNFAVAGK